mmetsp:Transcript_21745/g.10200  ORF Transcript_21745/g.10200 Transcript_21745/m.10200 type:complete len:90 (-) Transcript_21745:289-558(-)
MHDPKTPKWKVNYSNMLYHMKIVDEEVLISTTRQGRSKPPVLCKAMEEEEPDYEAIEKAEFDDWISLDKIFRATKDEEGKKSLEDLGRI